MPRPDDGRRRPLQVIPEDGDVDVEEVTKGSGTCNMEYRVSHGLELGELILTIVGRNGVTSMSKV